MKRKAETRRVVSDSTVIKREAAVAGNVFWLTMELFMDLSVMICIVTKILMQVSVLIATHGSAMSFAVDLLSHLPLVLQVVLQLAV